MDAKRIEPDPSMAEPARALSAGYRAAKRCTDLIVSGLALVVLGPGIVLLGVVIKLTSKGPVVFCQQRAGQGGKPFTLYKFRTMRCGVDPFGDSPRSDRDPRLTRIGRVLRELSLDELPQLWNVFKGDMSLVGPRPLYVSQIAEWNPIQRRRLLVKPGLTGLAQITGRGELTIEQKLDLDVQYADHCGYGLDIRILASTVGLVFRRKGIYEKQYSRDKLARSDRG